MPSRLVLAELIGGLYDAQAPGVIACIHASAETIIPEGQEEADPEQWRLNCRAVVRAKFTGLMHACMRELIERDVPVMVNPPPGWTPLMPVNPTQWPPRLRQTVR